MRARPKIILGSQTEGPPPRWQKAIHRGGWWLGLAALVALAWNSIVNPKIHLLPPGPGAWIVFPLPPELEVYPGVKLTGIFRRDFVLPEKPASAMLSWRCLTNGVIYVNNNGPALSAENWKATSREEVSPYLHAGTNEIRVRVENQLGPPALSLDLRGNNISLNSDESWEVEISGSPWRQAVRASVLPEPKKGNELSLMETMGGAFRQCGPALFLVVVLSLGVVSGWRHVSKWAPGVGAAAWLALLAHNIPFIPAAAGFDGRDHLAYVSYLQDHHELPDARQGWEMFQPPLYYIICATLLSAGHWGALDPAGLILLRCLNVLIGAATVGLVFAGLRLVFPGDRNKPLAGAALAAFLPAQLYLLHYTTNEILSAMFVTAALCVGLYILQNDGRRRGWSVLLGVFMGLALLSKASAVLVVPVILGAMALKLGARRERDVRIWLGALGGPLLICLVIGGWHYLRLWREFGNPLTGNWNSKVAAAWWQYKGLQTPGYFLSFGRALSHPFFSGLGSFWDGFYSTLWGDALLGGKVNVWSRPPWNYEWMTVGFAVALVPTILVLTGLVRTLTGGARVLNLTWVVLLGFGGLMVFAVLYMSLQVPSYAQTKAFYGLPALLPFCALGALGFEFWSSRARALRTAVWAASLVWIMVVYASFWIRPHTAAAEVSRAIARMLYLKGDPTVGFGQVLEDHPGNSEAAIWLASLESKQHPAQSMKLLEEGLKNEPGSGEMENFLAWDLFLTGRTEEAVAHARRATELEPGNEETFRTWSGMALRAGRLQDAVTACREALGINPADLKPRLDLAIALMNLGQLPEAINHFSAVIEAQPQTPEAQFCLGQCLLQQPGKHEEAVAHLREAVRLAPGKADWQTVLNRAQNGP